MTDLQNKENIEKRTEPRESYSGYTFFSVKNGVHEGSIKNFSKHGLFIATSISLPIGELITVALPYLDAKADKCKGQIIWCNKEGFGVELFRKRNGSSQKYIQSEIRLRKQRARTFTGL
jgi:hypothetical protein